MQELANYLFLQSYLKGQRWVSGVQAFTRPADTTTYTAPTSSAPGDLVANSVTAGSVAALQFSPPVLDANDTVAKGAISFVRLHDVGGTAAKSIRVHFIKAAATPAVAGGDNAQISITGLAAGAYLGFADVSLQPAAHGGAVGQNDLLRIPYELATGESIWTLHEALSAFQPANAGVFRELIACDRQQ